MNRLTLAVGFAAGYAAGAGGGPQARARLAALVRRPSRPAGVQQWTADLAARAGTVADSTRSAVRQAVATVGARLRRHDATPASPGASGGVIALSDVPVDQLSDWELDLLTTPDPSR